MAGHVAPYLAPYLDGWAGRTTLLATLLGLVYVGWLVTPGAHDPRWAAVHRAVVVPPALLATVLAWRAAGGARGGADRTPTHRAWHLWALAQSLWCAADVAWIWMGQPALSVADVGLLGSVPLQLAALLTFPTARPTRAERVQFALDTGTVLLGGSMAVWYVMLRPAAQAGPVDTLAAAVSLAYPVTDLLLLFGCAAILLRRPPAALRPALGLLATGVLVFFVGDLVGGSQLLDATYRAGGVIEVCALAANVAWAAAAHRATTPAAPAPAHPGSPASRGARVLSLPFLLPYGAVAVGYALLLHAATAAGRASGTPFGTLVAGAAALTALVCARQVQAMRENTRLSAENAEQRSTARLEARFRALVQHSSDVILVVDADTTVRFVSPAITRVLGHAPEAFVGTPLTAVLNADDGARAAALVERLEKAAVGAEVSIAAGPEATHADVASPAPSSATEHGAWRARHADGTWRHLEVTVTDLRHEPAVGGLVLNVRDVTERAASEARFRTIFEHAAVGVLLHGADGMIQEANPAFQAIVGYSLAELRTLRASELSPPEDAALTREPVRALQNGACDRVVVEKRFRRKDGTVRLCELTVSRVDTLDNRRGLVGMVQDVTEHRALQEQLAYRAYHDPLTGLANRARFHDRAAEALANAVAAEDGHHGGSASVAVLLVDLDGFKLVNDTAGHAAGDALLKEVAERLLSATRGSDLVARLGGDEFAVLLTDVRGDADTCAVADRIVAALARPVAVHGTTAVVGASVGIARGGVTHGVAPHGGMTSGGTAFEEPCDLAAMTPVDALLRDADLALYTAKARGRGQAAVFEPDMHAAVVERLALEGALRRGLERGEFRLVYQPIVDLATGALRGVEALVRWQHPARGLVSPAQFIPLAEETGLIVPLGRWVLGEACRQAAAWDAGPGAAGVYVTVNVSGRQLARAEFVDEVEAALAASGLAPARLTLELTESTVIHHPEVARQRLVALKALGVRLAIDDFGTGYSALSYLRQFPLDVLKIDKSFVDEIAGGGQPEALAAAIVALGDALALGTVAEGIETAEQALRLGAMGCALGQGYHFARPLAPDAIAAWLDAGHATTPNGEDAGIGTAGRRLALA